MDTIADIQRGMPVYGADGQSLGVVEAVDDDGLRVAGRQIPRSAIARVDDGAIHLHIAGAALQARADTTAPPTTAQSGASGDQIIIPLAEERPVVEQRETDLGEIIILKRIIEEERTVPVTVRREVLEVVRRDANGNEVVEELRETNA